MDLTEFLLARIAEDEYFGTHDRHLAKRWDAECGAKRQIVDRIIAYQRGTRDDLSGDWMGDDVLAFLALPYADHPEYNPKWRP